MDSQYAPRLRSARTVCRVLSKRPNDVAARLDQLIKIVRIRITSGYGMLLRRPDAIRCAVTTVNVCGRWLVIVGGILETEGHLVHIIFVRYCDVRTVCVPTDKE